MEREIVEEGSQKKGLKNFAYKLYRKLYYPNKKMASIVTYLSQDFNEYLEKMDKENNGIEFFERKITEDSEVTTAINENRAIIKRENEEHIFIEGIFDREEDIFYLFTFDKIKNDLRFNYAYVVPKEGVITMLDNNLADNIKMSIEYLTIANIIISNSEYRTKEYSQNKDIMLEL